MRYDDETAMMKAMILRESTKTMLYVFSGLPATGKSTLAQLLAARVGAAYVRIDTIEQALRDLCAVDVQDEGYRLAYRVAADILRSGVSVVADCCNPIAVTRSAWEEVARDVRTKLVNVEIVCSDRREHRRRVEQRPASVAGLRQPTWADVVAREYDQWTTGRIVIDTANGGERQCLEQLLADLREYE